MPFHFTSCTAHAPIHFTTNPCSTCSLYHTITTVQISQQPNLQFKSWQPIYSIHHHREAIICPASPLQSSPPTAHQHSFVVPVIFAINKQLSSLRVTRPEPKHRHHQTGVSQPPSREAQHSKAEPSLSQPPSISTAAAIHLTGDATSP
jgi:hypothetical protein